MTTGVSRGVKGGVSRLYSVIGCWCVLRRFS